MDNDFIQGTAERVVDWINEQVAYTIIEEINNLIGLDKIIADDLANRIKLFEESRDSVEDEEIKNMMEVPTIEFPNVTAKLEYAFKALLHAGYTFTHDINYAGKVTVRFFKQEFVKYFILDTKFSTTIEEYVEPVEETI